MLPCARAHVAAAALATSCMLRTAVQCIHNVRGWRREDPTRTMETRKPIGNREEQRRVKENRRSLNWFIPSFKKTVPAAGRPRPGMAVTHGMEEALTDRAAHRGPAATLHTRADETSNRVSWSSWSSRLAPGEGSQPCSAQSDEQLTACRSRAAFRSPSLCNVIHSPSADLLSDLQLGAVMAAAPRWRLRRR